MRRRAQSGSNAAILVALMALLIILYILFLPPDVREELLEGNYTDNGTSSTDDGLNKTLLQEKPGTIDYVDSDYRNHELPSFRLYSAEEGRILKEQTSLYVKNSAFEKSFSSITFKADSPDYDNFLLSFNVEKAEGMLLLILNGQEIYNGKIELGSPAPIKLPKDLIQDENTLRVEVSNVGWAIWKVNEYLLKNIKITADFTDKSASKSQHHFFINQEEKDYIDRATLFFYPRCDTGEVGILSIELNNVRIYSSIADCGVNNYIPLNPEYLYTGENTISFSSDKGSYLIDNLRVRTYIKAPIYPIYYFEVDDDFFQTIDEDDPDNDELKDKWNAVLKIRFVNREDKKGEIIINGRTLSFNTDDLEYKRYIDDYIMHGSNAIELIPRTTLDIVSLKIGIEED